MSASGIRCMVVLLAALAWLPTPRATPLPPVERVAFAPAPDARLPLGADFRDALGHRVRLRDLLGRRPAIVVPAYYGCANLCTIVLHATADALARAGLRAGRDVDVVAVSIDPLDTPAAARAKKREVLSGVPGDERDAWHFLTGDERAIASVANALGYRYAYVADEHQYAHAAGIVLVARDGRVVRVLYGAAFPAGALRAALAQAEGTAGSAARVSAPAADDNGAATRWLLCFHYDPKSGRYTFAAMNAVRAAGLLALFALAVYAARAWRRERRTRTEGVPR